MRLPPFHLERHFAAHEFQVRRSLSSSDCEPLSVEQVLALADDEVRGLWQRASLGYTESAGHPLLRAEICKQYEDIDPCQVVCTVPQEGILLALWSCVTPGARVIVTAPAYQSLYEVPRSLGGHVSLWLPDETPRGFFFDPDRLRKLAGKRADVIVVNFPHNPTGALPTRAEFDEIVAIAKSSGAVLFSDEMYRALELEGPPLPSACELYDRAVSLGGLSKALSAPGLRAGHLVSRSRALMDRVAELKDYTTICGSATSEILAIAVLRAKERILSANRTRVRENSARVTRFAQASAGRFEWTPPRAGSVGLARLTGGETASALSARLLRERNLLLVASNLFDFGDAHVRFGLGRADLDQGLDELLAFLA